MIMEHQGEKKEGNYHQDDDDMVRKSFPPQIRARYPASPSPIAHFIKGELSAERLQELLIPQDILDKSWAKSRLSVVGPQATATQCFTKGYARIYDRSTGSCYLDDEDVVGGLESLESWTSLYGTLRLFDPDDMLALFGFPPGFRWPPSMPVRKKWACIGNSVNVHVVQGVMACLFEVGM